MQSPLSSFIFLQSGSGLTAGTAFITVFHIPHCLSYSPCFLKDACIYLSHLLQCITPECIWSPGQRPFLMLPMQDSAPVLGPPDTTDSGTTTIFLQRRWWSLVDTFPNTSIVLRNTVDLYKGLHGRAERLIFRCTAEIHNAPSSLSVYSPSSSSLCRKIDCIDYFTDVYSIPFTFGSQKQRGFWEMRGVCDANRCCNANRCGCPLYSENIFQEVTELLKPASPAGHSPARQINLLRLRLTFRSLLLYIPSRNMLSD